MHFRLRVTLCAYSAIHRRICLFAVLLLFILLFVGRSAAKWVRKEWKEKKKVENYYLTPLQEWARARVQNIPASSRTSVYPQWRQDLWPYGRFPKLKEVVFFHTANNRNRCERRTCLCMRAEGHPSGFQFSLLFPLCLRFVLRPNCLRRFVCANIVLKWNSLPYIHFSGTNIWTLCVLKYFSVVHLFVNEVARNKKKGQKDRMLSQWSMGECVEWALKV